MEKGLNKVMRLRALLSGWILIGWFGWVSVAPGWADEQTPKQVCLTFDDGPLSGTREILAVLTREEVPGTFFLIGEHVTANNERRETLKMLKESPRVRIANHSHTHAHERYRAFYADPDGMLMDFRKNNEILGFSQPPYPTRLPGRIDWRYEGHYVSADSHPKNSPGKAPIGIEKLFEHGFVIYGWDVEWGRPGRQNPLESVDGLLSRIRQRLDNGKTVQPDRIVILMHDFHFNNAAAIEALGKLIQRLKAGGYRFKWMDD
ncbi:MAG: polysaccharide deacetylase family protein [Magnetococcus sp. YQC-9]